jgi:hypothetical protein
VLGIFKCDEVIKGFGQLRVKIGIDKCAQLCGGVVFFFEIQIGWINSFLQQKAGNHSFTTLVA